uniref:Glutamyl aminopeptidase n=1 Tax=Apis cerana TaxID=7461 RepID=V9IBL0_APICE
MIQDRKGHRLKISRLLEYPKHQQLYLELEESKFRKRGNYTVHLRFISKLSSELEGFYLSSYVTPEGEKRSL